MINGASLRNVVRRRIGGLLKCSMHSCVVVARNFPLSERKSTRTFKESLIYNGQIARNIAMLIHLIYIARNIASLAHLANLQGVSNKEVLGSIPGIYEKKIKKIK